MNDEGYNFLLNPNEGRLLQQVLPNPAPDASATLQLETWRAVQLLWAFYTIDATGALAVVIPEISFTRGNVNGPIFSSAQTVPIGATVFTTFGQTGVASFLAGTRLYAMIPPVMVEEASLITIGHDGSVGNVNVRDVTVALRVWPK